MIFHIYLQLHIYCFADTPVFDLRLLNYFPSLHIGMTGFLLRIQPQHRRAPQAHAGH